jgi:hypothetical protein
MERYTIKDRSEESECQYCGYPLYVGDRAMEHNDGVYCSKTCANSEWKVIGYLPGMQVELNVPSKPK